MKLIITKYKLLFLLIFSITILNQNTTISQNFKIVFDYYNSVKEYNVNELDQMIFNTLQNNYFFNIYSKSQGRIIYETRNLYSLRFRNDSLSFTYNSSQISHNYNDIDSLAFRLYPEENYTIKELELDEVLLTEMGNAWGLAFLDNENVLITEKNGKLTHFNIITKIKNDIKNIPIVSTNGQGGLLDVKLHPNFSENNVIFISYALAVGNEQTTAVTRAVLNLNQMSLTDKLEIFRAVPAVNSSVHFGSRISFDKYNNVFISTGERGNSSNAQNTLNHWGKIIKVTEFGEVPADNPFVSSNLHLPEIWSYGHRNIQGMDTHPVTGELWAHEHGPKGGDELNLIKKGANYGWPLATFGINYNGTEITKDTTYPGCEDPITYWKPSIAPCGMTFVRDNKNPNEADILIGALAGQHIARVHIVDNKLKNEIQSLYNYARFRDVKQSPDGRIYAITEDGRFIRLKEKK